MISLTHTYNGGIIPNAIRAVMTAPAVGIINVRAQLCLHKNHVRKTTNIEPLAPAASSNSPFSWAQGVVKSNVARTDAMGKRAKKAIAVR